MLEVQHSVNDEFQFLLRIDFKTLHRDANSFILRNIENNYEICTWNGDYLIKITATTICKEHFHYVITNYHFHEILASSRHLRFCRVFCFQTTFVWTIQLVKWRVCVRKKARKTEFNTLYTRLINLISSFHCSTIWYVSSGLLVYFTIVWKKLERR